MDNFSGLQDGMLEYYQQQAKASDVNVEKRIDSEPFNYADYLTWLYTCPTSPALSITVRSPSIAKEPS